MSLTLDHMVIILAMAAVTYLTRIIGYWWIGQRQLAPWASHVLRAVPSAVLVAVIAPAIFASGVAGLITGAVTIIAAMRLPLLAVVVIAVITSGLCRSFLP